jgi:fucose 4-O-acetylase-like acetyltransferase
MKERILSIDRMRGINMFLVVFGHFIFFNVKDFSSVNIGVWGTTFRMATFMFLCGYIAHKTTSVKILNSTIAIY